MLMACWPQRLFAVTVWLRSLSAAGAVPVRPDQGGDREVPQRWRHVRAGGAQEHGPVALRQGPLQDRVQENGPERQRRQVTALPPCWTTVVVFHYLSAECTQSKHQSLVLCNAPMRFILCSCTTTCCWRAHKRLRCVVARYVGRPSSASTACGKKNTHLNEESNIKSQAFAFEGDF